MASNPKQCTKVLPCHKIIYDTLSCIQTSAYNCITKETQDIINELKYLVDNNYLSYKPLHSSFTRSEGAMILYIMLNECQNNSAKHGPLTLLLFNKLAYGMKLHISSERVNVLTN